MTSWVTSFLTLCPMVAQDWVSLEVCEYSTANQARRYEINFTEATSTNIPHSLTSSRSFAHVSLWEILVKYGTVILF
ncbi:hypothetical protein M758_1G181400 [Ceratodon purpureus]|uniref:Secreted protein n=1 Tax=Ceratodon purpureus TaxID=3225 RepID=A0A8T0J9N7_CERPU|nr:hypothetical protein KC19_1G184200 [Ceratodon purpureus]KAG0630483.1 hypothetical protein M758_1G181400 [Ceratodon purpureus]